MIEPIPSLPPGLKRGALRGTLIPFVGAGASRLAGCPNWGEFAERALRYFVDQGKLTHGQLAQLSQQHPRVKLSLPALYRAYTSFQLNSTPFFTRAGATLTPRAAGSMMRYANSEKFSSLPTTMIGWTQRSALRR